MKATETSVAFTHSRVYSVLVFSKRSTELERIDTGDYTPDEYATFLREIRFINRYLGDTRALRKSLLHLVEREDMREFSVLDVACGSGELLRQIAKFARSERRAACLTGIDLNELSFPETKRDTERFPEIAYVRGDAFHMPFADDSFDFAISSLFFHHLKDEQIPSVLFEMSRVARRRVFIIDLHRHTMAYALYKLFCLGFRISPLVTQDGSLSILKGFRPGELDKIASRSDLITRRVSPFRLVVEAAPANEV